MISPEVKKKIKKRLQKIDPAYELEYVCHLNNIKADEYLYLVIAEDTKLHASIPEDCRYIVYTYNDSLQSMNHGHYNITLTNALELILNKRKEYENE